MLRLSWGLLVLLAGTACQEVGAPALPRDYPIESVPVTAVQVPAEWGAWRDTNRQVALASWWHAPLVAAARTTAPATDPALYALLEAATYRLATQPDPRLRARLDSLIARMTATPATAVPPAPLYRAAATHYQVTGQSLLLDLARQVASLPTTSGENAAPAAEALGLAHLYRATGERRYLDLAQTRLPAPTETTSLDLYSSMAELFALSGDSSYWGALATGWQQLLPQVSLTGDLADTLTAPGARSVVLLLEWTHRMFRLEGHGRYYDLFERILYNALLREVTAGQLAPRPSPPAPLVRFLASLPGYLYAQREGAVYVNLYLSSEATLPGRGLRLRQATDYPWAGNIRLEVIPRQPETFTLCLRLPGWTNNEAFPTGRYRYQSRTNTKLVLRVNGELVFPELVDGYAQLTRPWTAGDVVELGLPLPVRRVSTQPVQGGQSDQLALMRGPVVYTLEGVAGEDPTHPLQLPRLGKLEVVSSLAGLPMITGTAYRAGTAVPLRAVPYGMSALRHEDQESIWLPVQE